VPRKAGEWPLDVPGQDGRQAVTGSRPDTQPARDGGFLRTLSHALRRVPPLVLLAQRAYQRTQPRYTLGVVGVLPDETGARVLLVEHVLHASHPWGLPGGWLGRSEDPAQAVVREFREETGLRVRAVRPLLIQRAPGMRGHMDVAYLCALEDGPQDIQLSRELLTARWLAWDALPPLLDFQRQALAAAFDGAVQTVESPGLTRPVVGGERGVR